MNFVLDHYLSAARMAAFACLAWFLSGPADADALRSLQAAAAPAATPAAPAAPAPSAAPAAAGTPAAPAAAAAAAGKQTSCTCWLSCLPLYALCATCLHLSWVALYGMIVIMMWLQ
jgi:hypothetical protein